MSEAQSVDDHSFGVSFGYVVQLASCSVSSGDALLLLIEHMVRVLCSTTAPSSITSFLSAAAAESVKAIDVKLAIERCRVAALGTTNLIARLVKRQAHTDQPLQENDGQDEQQQQESALAEQSSSESQSSSVPPSSEQLVGLLSSLQSRLRAGSRHGRVRDAMQGRAEAVGRKRRAWRSGAAQSQSRRGCAAARGRRER